MVARGSSTQDSATAKAQRAAIPANGHLKAESIRTVDGDHPTDRAEAGERDENQDRLAPARKVVSAM